MHLSGMDIRYIQGASADELEALASIKRWYDARELEIHKDFSEQKHDLERDLYRRMDEAGLSRWKGQVP